MSTDKHNGVDNGPMPEALTVNHSGVGSGGGAGGNLVGVFGNNWMLNIPTSGPVRRGAPPVRHRSDALRDDWADLYR